jgi:hypothetical protein
MNCKNCVDLRDMLSAINIMKLTYVVILMLYYSDKYQYWFHQNLSPILYLITMK